MSLETVEHRFPLVIFSLQLLMMLMMVDSKAVQKEFCADKAPGLYPDPLSCSFYYSCANGQTYRMPCPAALYFDPRFSVCNWPYDLSDQRKQECQRLSVSTSASSSSQRPNIPTSTTTARPTSKGTDPLLGLNLRLPRSLQLRFSFGTKSVALDVDQSPTSTAAASPKVITSFRGRISEWKTNETFAVYSNKDKTATFVASTESKKGSQLNYRGNFNIDGKQYFLKPKGALNIVPVTSKDDQINYNGNQYIVSNEGEQSLTCPEGSGRRKRAASDGTTPSFVGAVPSASASSSTSTKQRYWIELLLAIDFATYYKFYMQSTASTAQDKRTEAINNIRFYFAHIANGMDNRYASINQSDFSINVRLVGYFISETQSDSPFSEQYGIKFDGYYTDANYCLGNFTNWLTQNAARLPRYDLALLFTSNLLFAGYRSDNTRRVISGLAYIDTVCNNNLNTGVCYEFGEYSSIETLAHEAGHIVGAQHDSSLYNSCNGASQYIMASSPGVLTNETFKNPFTFSSCSVDYFRRTISRLNNANANCLINEPFSLEPNATGNLPPGQKFKPDVQCQLIYGQSSFYCGGGNRDQSICRTMLCWSPSDGFCYASIEQRAYDGTTCANGSWCYMGECVKDDMAPRAPLSCIYGDYRDTYTIDNQKYTCAQIGSYKPYLCYDIGYSGECCATCGAIKDTSKPGCEYGDREPDWCRTTLRPYDCNDASVRTRCCATCPRYFTGISGCEYGDGAEWCPQITAQQCYQSASTCCSSCRRFYTGAQGCEYGDKSTGCSSYVSSCLSNSNIADVCCGTCYAAYPTTRLPSTTRTTTRTTISTTVATTTTTLAPDNPPPCELGDRDSFCSTLRNYDCYRSDYQSLCCKTCSGYRNASNPGCEYGDKVDWCSTYVKGPTECQRPEVMEYCCDTCQKYNSGALQPVCADKADYCNGSFAGYCYDPQFQDTCCVTCKSYKQSQANCEYGDKFSWCASQYCDQNRIECCATCK